VGVDPSPLFFGSVDSTGDEVVCFHADLEVLILMGLEEAVFGAISQEFGATLFSKLGTEKLDRQDSRC